MRYFGKKSVFALLCCMFAAFVLTALPASYGQDLAGMTGEVTDQSGAGVPKAVVVLTNPTTGAKFTTTTNETGFYRFAQIPPGEGYQATFTATGFKPITVNSIYLTVATIRTQNATMTVGATAQTVEVSASNSEVTIDTTTASVGNTFDVTALDNLPVQQRNSPTALFVLQPGVTDTGAVTGARVDQNYVTLDGLDVNDLATGGAAQTNSGGGISSGFNAGSIVAHAPVDSVEEFHGTVAGNPAGTGTSSGGQFQLVTKSGTNQFHGDLNEYHRDPSLVANSWFANNSTPIVPRNHLIQNQFGGNLGGPIKKDKLFFFFNFDDSRIIRSILTQRTVPLDSLRNGNITYCTNADCSTTNVLTPAQVQALDPAGIGESATFFPNFNARFPHSNNNVTGDGINSGGYTFNAPFNDDETNYVGRGDYSINDSQKVFARFSILRENAVQNANEFSGDPITDPVVDRSYAWVIGHNWVIGANKTNRVFLGETVQKLNFADNFNPGGTTFLTFGDGTRAALTSSLYLNPFASARRVPIPVIGDDFSLTHGNHTLQWGGTFKDILLHSTSRADYNTVQEGLGGTTLSLCGPTPGDCGGTNPSLRPADINQGNVSEQVYDQAFAFSLARIGSISSDYNYNAQAQVLPQLTGDQRLYRYYQTQLYVSDSWKVTPSITATYGLTWQWFTVPYETHGLESVEPFTFDQYFGARVEQSALAETGPNAVPLIAYYLGGKGNGSGAPGLYQPEYRNLAPHVGIIWNPGFDKKSVINFGAGIVYDRTVINAVQAAQDADSYLFQQTKPVPQGIQDDPYDSIKTGARLDANDDISAVPLSAPATPRQPYQPFVANGIPFGLATTQGFNATIDPSLKTPYSIIYNAGVQRSFSGGFVLKVNYAGRLGRRLLAQADANQVLEFPDQVSGQLLSQAFAAIITQTRQGVPATSLTPQPWFENVATPGVGVQHGFANNTQFLAATNQSFVANGDFGDFVAFGLAPNTPLNVGSAAQFSENTFFTNKGFSSYNALLLSLQKNLSYGLHFDFNYTFAHSIDNISFFANSAGDTGIGGVGLICDDIRPRECRANSDFDVKHSISADVAYALPFGKGKLFLGNQPHWIDEVVGGWTLSGITDWHTGQAFGTSSNAFVASFSNDAPAIFIGTNKSVIATHVTKLPGGGVNVFKNGLAASEAYEGPIGFQIGARNSLRGPRYFNEDLGLGKTFPLYEKYSLNFRADAFNAFNHPNFASPASNSFNGLDQQDYLEGAGFGQISSTADPENNLNSGARVLQLSLRLEF